VRAWDERQANVQGLLDPSSSHKDIASGVEQIVAALESIALRATSAHDSRETPERETEQGRTSEGEQGGADLHATTQGRLWLPRRRSAVWTPGELRQQEVAQERLEPVQVFCGNARPDDDHKVALLKHLAALRRNRIIRTWHEGELRAGDDRDADIWRNFELARLILLLISADFLSDEIEMLDKVERRSDHAVVIPFWYGQWTRRNLR
jgi:hypothetical protein